MSFYNSVFGHMLLICGEFAKFSYDILHVLHKMTISYIANDIESGHAPYKTAKEKPPHITAGRLKKQYTTSLLFPGR